MRKLVLSSVMCCLMATTMYAQYPHTLPITPVEFFAASAMGDNPTLEKGNYNATTDAIMQNQWNLTGASATSYEFGTSAVIENSTLAYLNYVDNNAGKAIVFDAAITGQRRTIFSLTSVTADYRDKGAYYLSFLVNFSKVPASPRFFIAWDGNHTANQQRGVLYVKEVEGGFQLGKGLTTTSSTVTVWSSTLSLNQTHLVVMKVNPISTGDPEVYSFYVNPAVGAKEVDVTPITTFENTGTPSSRIAGVKGITIVQNTDIGLKLAGLRFSDKWEDVVKGSPNAVANSKKSNLQVFVNANKQLVIRSDEQLSYVVYSFNGSEIAKGISTDAPLSLKKGVYIVKAGAESFKIVL